MKSFDSDTLDRLDAGEVDYIDALTGIFDSGVVNLVPGIIGSFTFEDDQIGEQTFYGSGALLSLEVPAAAAGNEADALRVRLAETYMPQGATVPVNVFDDGVRASIDEEPWQGREVIVSCFWRGQDGAILCREQVARRVFDAMPVEVDEAGNPVRIAMLELPTIVQRDIEGKTHNSAFQAQIDPADLAFEHVGVTATQRITLGAMPDQRAKQ